MKFIANHLVTIHNLAATEAIVLGEMAGRDPALIFDVIADSAGSSHIFQICGPMIVATRIPRRRSSPPRHSSVMLVSRKAARPRRPGHRRGLRRSGRGKGVRFGRAIPEDNMSGNCYGIEPPP
jgi:hypothetical protein